MTELTLDSVWREVYDGLGEDLVPQVYSVFEDYFGEDRVDLQRPITTFESFLEYIYPKQVSDYLAPINDTYFPNSDRRDRVIELARKTIGELTVEETQFLLNLIVYYHDNFKQELLADLNSYIYIYFPTIEITNEQGNSHTIKDLYVQVKVFKNGRLNSTFAITRSKFTIDEWNSYYMHSHAPRFNHEGIHKFRTTCLGDGPISSTISLLARDFDALRWQLFCIELESYLGVESIDGGPYIYMSDIISSDNRTVINKIQVPLTNIKNNFPIMFNEYQIFDKFVEYLIQSDILVFNYYNGSYNIADSYVDFIVKVSNLFIEWHNNQDSFTYNFDDYKNHGVLKDCKYTPQALISSGDTNYDNLNQYQNRPLFTFKGNTVKLIIENVVNTNDIDNTIYILNPRLVDHLIYNLLRIINAYYGKHTTRTSSEFTADENNNVSIVTTKKEIRVI